MPARDTKFHSGFRPSYRRTQRTRRDQKRPHSFGAAIAVLACWFVAAARSAFRRLACFCIIRLLQLQPLRSSLAPTSWRPPRLPIMMYIAGVAVWIGKALPGWRTLLLLLPYKIERGARGALARMAYLVAPFPPSFFVRDGRAPTLPWIVRLIERKSPNTSCACHGSKIRNWLVTAFLRWGVF